MTAQQLARSISRTFTLQACPGLVLGPGAVVASHGPPGGGKSSQLLRVADELKPSIVLPMEMGAGPLLAAMLQRLEVRSPEIGFHEPRSLVDILELAATPGLKCLLIDSLSVSCLQPDDVRTLARANNIIVWGVLQERKSGGFFGSNAWKHECDVMLAVDGMKWRLEKSRYQALPLEGDVCSSAPDTPAYSA